MCVCVFQFVEKRREMKSDGRTDKELEESYCFLLTDTDKVRLRDTLQELKSSNKTDNIQHTALVTC